MNNSGTTIVLAVAALCWATPLMAHHNSADPEFVEQHMPDDALDQHNTQVDLVLDRLGEIGNRSMSTAGSADANPDPADALSGETCSVMVDGVCSRPGEDTMSGYGMEQSPQVFEYPDP